MAKADTTVALKALTKEIAALKAQNKKAAPPPQSHEEVMQTIYEAQAIFAALAADAKLRQFCEDEDSAEGMWPGAVETLARRGWQLLEGLPDWPDDEAEVKAEETGYQAA